MEKLELFGQPNNLPDEEFKEMVIKIVSKLRKRIEEHTENFNKELENMKIPIMVSSEDMPRSGTAGSYGSSMFSFLRTSILFFTVTRSIYIPTNSVGLALP